MGSTSMAELSNLLVYATLIVLAMAMFCFALDLGVGSGRRRAVPRTGTALCRTQARAHSGGGVDVRQRVESADVVVDERWARIGLSLSTLAFLLLVAAVVTRGVSAGRPPWGNMYEFSLAGATAAMGVWLLLVQRRKEARELGLLVTLAVLLILGVAVVVLYTESAQLVPALKSYWLWIHVSAAIIASGIFTVGSVASALFLITDRHDRRLAAGSGSWGSSRPARRTPAVVAVARPGGLPNDCGGLPAVVLRHRGWRDLGRGRMGALLGLGSQGNLGIHHPGYLRRVPARPLDGRMARASGRRHRAGRIRRVPVQLHRRQHLLFRPALLRRRLAASSSAQKWDGSGGGGGFAAFGVLLLVALAPDLLVELAQERRIVVGGAGALGAPTGATLTFATNQSNSEVDHRKQQGQHHQNSQHGASPPISPGLPQPCFQCQACLVTLVSSRSSRHAHLVTQSSHQQMWCRRRQSVY